MKGNSNGCPALCVINTILPGKTMMILRKLFALLVLAIVSSCASYPDKPLWDQSLVYNPADNKELIYRHAPVFVIEEADKEYNKIGTVIASNDGGNEEVRVDPQTGTYYATQKSFTTLRGSYTNLYYRVHFSEVPSGLIPFYLGAGENVGLFVVATLDNNFDPVLYTIVHTCGCYLAFLPTSYLPEDIRGEGWQGDRQIVYGENLPAFLQYTLPQKKQRLILHIRHGSHRVKNVWLASREEINEYQTVIPLIKPLETLEKLELPDGSTTSFYETSGSRMGYVKGSHKIWERLLISWWAFDWRVGEDKKLGEDATDSDSIVFYTSLKPWAREESDMRDFAGFLNYWGWEL